MLRACLFYFCGVLGIVTSAWAQPTLEELSIHPRWQRLLHYSDSKSEVDSETFFVSPDGATNSVGELQALLDVLEDPKATYGVLSWHPQCVFPARVKFLRAQLGRPRLKVSCPVYDEWRAQLDVASISFVFSTPYVGNPASFFGHTLLRLRRRSPHFLKDYGVSFTADTNPDHNIVSYALRGVFGAYEGRFSVFKYYEKIGEYNQNEFRDLWEYELQLQAEELDYIVAHLWELLKTAAFDYYFADENCTYQLLKLLEVGCLDWKIAQKKLFYVLPADVIKRMVSTKGIVKEIYFQPSQHRELLARDSDLTDTEKKTLRRAIKKPEVLEEIKSSRVLITLASYYQYRKNLDGQEDQRPLMERRLKKVLIQRAKLKMREDYKPAISKPDNRPDWAHDNFLVSLQGGWQYQRALTGLRLRLGAHDFLNPSRGHELGSSFELLDVHLRYYPQEEKFELGHVTLLQATSLYPVTSFYMPMSWRLNFAYTDIGDPHCRFCHHFLMEGGGGFSASLNKGLLAYLFLEGVVELSSKYRSNVHFGGQPGLQLTWEWGNWTRTFLRTVLKLRWNGGGNFSWGDHTQLGFSFSWTKNLETRLTTNWMARSTLSQARTASLMLETGMHF